MKLWLDCEWNGYRGELLSVALVDEERGYFYERFRLPERIDPWVKCHVIPHIEGIPPLTQNDVQVKLQEFLMAYSDIHIITDWPEDIQHFCELLITCPGERLNTPPLTFEVLRDLDTVPSEIPHHALHDAYGLRQSYWYNNLRVINNV